MNPTKILSTLHIRPGEGWLVSWMMIYAVFMGIPALITETAAYSLFLQEFSAQSIPYIYVGFAVVTTLSGLAYTALEKRISFALFVTINLSILTLAPLVFRIFLEVSTTKWILPGLAIWYEVSWALASLGFWSMAVHLFDLRQGKRLFGLIGVGLTLSEAIPGFLVPAFVRLVGTANLLLVASASFLGAMLVQTYILRFARQTSEADKEQESEIDYGGSLIDLFKNNYIALIFGLAGLYAVSFYTLDNAFYDQVEIHYQNTDELASFLGIFFGLSSLLTLILGAFASSRLISRYGLRFGLLLMPVVILIGVTLAALVGTFSQVALVLFWVVAATRFVNEALAYTINRAAWQVLYEPLPEHLQLRSQTVVESIIKPVAGGIAGLLLIGFSALFGFSTVQIAYLLIIVLIAWIGVVVWINRLYPVVLLQALVKRRLTETTVEINRSHIGIFKAGLRSPHVGVVIYSLNKLEELMPELLPDFLEELLTHPAPEIRQTALERIEIWTFTSVAPAVRQLIEQDPSEKVRGCALRTLAALEDESALDLIYTYLDSPLFQMRLGAMAGLLKYTNPGHQLRVTLKHKLTGWATSAQLEERLLAAQVLGQIEIDDLTPLLLQLLNDDKLEIREAALRATKKLHNSKIWDAVIQSLDAPKVRPAAFKALVSAGRKILPQLQSALAKQHHNKALLIQLIQICGRIRGDEAIAILINYLDFPDIQVRTHALNALYQCKYQVAESEQMLITQRIKTEAAQATWILAAIVKIAADNGDHSRWSLIESALENELAGYRWRVFTLLSFIYPRQTILSAWNSLEDGAPSSTERWDKKKSYALEIVDVTISTQLRSLVLPLLDNLTPGQRLASLEQIFPQQSQDQHHYLTQIITASEAQVCPWTKAATLHVVTQLELKPLAPAVAKAAHSSDKLVHTTAHLALQQLNPDLYNAIFGDGNNSHHCNGFKHTSNREKKMLSLVERIILLKSVGIFSETPEEVLAEVAFVLEEMEVKAGEIIIEKGGIGSALYIIIDGEVAVQDGTRVITKLGESEVFGEFSLLDPGPRTATVTALAATRLFRLDQEAFLELLADHSTIARKIIQVLVRYLRTAHFQFNTAAYQDDSLNSPGK